MRLARHDAGIAVRAVKIPGPVADPDLALEADGDLIDVAVRLGIEIAEEIEAAVKRPRLLCPGHAIDVGPRIQKSGELCADRVEIVLVGAESGRGRIVVGLVVGNHERPDTARGAGEALRVGGAVREIAFHVGGNRIGDVVMRRSEDRIARQRNVHERIGIVEAQSLLVRAGRRRIEFEAGAAHQLVERPGIGHGRIVGVIGIEQAAIRIDAPSDAIDHRFGDRQAAARGRSVRIFPAVGVEFAVLLPGFATLGPAHAQHGVAATIAEIAADETADLRRLVVARVSDAVLRVELKPFEIVAEDEIDDAGDGVRAIDRRRAAADHLDILDRIGGDRVHVHQ